MSISLRLVIKAVVARCAFAAVGAAFLVAGPVPARADVTAPDVAPTCRDALLAELGWRVARADVATTRIDAGAPCDRASLADAHAHGDLRVATRDGTLTDADRDALFAHPATTCAFAFRLGDATRTAIDRLAANDGFRFTAVQLGWIGFGRGGATADGWQPVASFRRALQPIDTPSRALDAFYRGTVRSECGVGRQVAQYAAQRELYGDAAFDAQFAPAEITIGTFVQLHDTDSILLGRHAGELVGDGRARDAARLGRQAFAGRPGFIVHVRPSRYLDDSNNQAQNFVVHDVDADAAASLRAHDGFAHFNAINARAWRLARASGITQHGAFERLLVDRERNLRRRLTPSQRDAIDAIDRLFDDPFYRGFRIYVHHHGVRDLRFHLARLFDKNPRTPFRIELVRHNLHTTLMHRWFDHRLRACAARP